MGPGWVTVLLAWVPVPSLCLNCFYTTPTTSFSSLPSLITCTCRGEEGGVWEWSHLPNLDGTSDLNIPPSVTEVMVTNCSRLLLNLTMVPSSPPSLSLVGLENVEILVASQEHLNITMENVTMAEYVIVPATGEENEVYMFLAIGLGSLLVVLLVIIFILLVWLRRRGRGEEDNKKVARAESWRYESSIYVNPPTRQKPVYVAPPLPPPLPDSVPSTWSRAHAGAESASSTPLLRSKYSLHGVDLVRTSLPAPTSHPPPQAAQDRQREAQLPTQENRSDSEEEPCEAQNSSTLPHR